MAASRTEGCYHISLFRASGDSDVLEDFNLQYISRLSTWNIKWSRYMMITSMSFHCSQMLPHEDSRIMIHMQDIIQFIIISNLSP